jgi:ribosomal protein L16 Arg81 hydroxylase|eukprot:COSAG02_NODE_512_length_20850_cov_4.993302_4_plen_141_part_00
MCCMSTVLGLVLTVCVCLLSLLQTAHASKVSQRQQAFRKLAKQIKEKRVANEKLDASIMDASVAVAQREQISAMQKTAADKEGMARRRMKEVVTRRRLLELARAQTDEVDILREELDRLRQRTFPSFHQLQHVAGSMDEF